MWHLISETLRSRRARKTAVATISPIVEQSRQRLGGISDDAWSDPYIIGFIVMLISVIARLEGGRIADRALCRVQSRAWQDITSMQGSAIVEELLLLSSARNREFELGCHNAATFGSILFGTSILLEGAGVPQLAMPDGFLQREDVSAAWAQYFDAHVPQQRNAGAQPVPIEAL
jgi:hypothetical protein